MEKHFWLLYKLILYTNIDKIWVRLIWYAWAYTCFPIGVQLHFPCFSSSSSSSFCVQIFCHRLLCARNDVKLPPSSQMWLKMNALATIGRFRHHPTFASYIMKSIHTHINMAGLITKNTNRRSRWQVQVAFLISHTLQSGLDRKLRAFGRGKKKLNKNRVCLCVCFSKKEDDRRRSFQTIVFSSDSRQWWHVIEERE